MKYADLQPPEVGLLAGRPLWSTTVSSSSGDWEPPEVPAMALFQP